MANKPCKRCGRTNWWWSDIDKCSKCEGEEMTTATLPKTDEHKKHEEETKRREETQKKVAEENKKQREELQKTLGDILHEFGGQESNIPINHGYWDMLNQFRALSKDTRGVEVIEPMDEKIKNIIELASSDSASAKKAIAAINEVVEQSTTPIPPGGPVTAESKPHVHEAHQTKDVAPQSDVPHGKISGEGKK